MAFILKHFYSEARRIKESKNIKDALSLIFNGKRHAAFILSQPSSRFVNHLFNTLRRDLIITEWMKHARRHKYIIVVSSSCNSAWLMYAINVCLVVKWQQLRNYEGLLH